MEIKEVDAKWTFEFFNHKFEGLIATISHQDAYWKLEEEHYSLFGRQRYVDYDSFRLRRRKYLKRLIKRI